MSDPRLPLVPRRRLRNLARALLNFALPDACLHCGAPLVDGEPCLCAVCVDSLRLDGGRVPLSQNLDSLEGCGLPLDALFAIRYAGAARALVRALKFGDRPDAAPLLAAPLLALLDLKVPASGRARVLIVPVPLHRTRRRERGYDQTLLLARAVAAMGDGYAVDAGLLQRSRATGPQSRLPGSDRPANVSGCFRVVRSTPGERAIILLDDVVTTGATMKAAAAAFHETGVRVHLAAAAVGPQLDVPARKATLEPPCMEGTRQTTQNAHGAGVLELKRVDTRPPRA